MARYKHGQKPPRRPRNKWTHDQRLTLHLLRARFGFNMTERTRVFNAVFADHLRRQGFTDGMQLHSISAQYAESEGTKPSMIAAWADVTRPPASPEESAKRYLIAEQIVRTARTLNIVAKRTSVTTCEIERPSSNNALRKQGWVAPMIAPDREGLDDSHVTDSDREYTPPPTPTPKRVKGAGSQLSKCTFQASRVESDTTTASDSDAEFLPQRSARPAKRVRTDPKVVIPTTPKHRGAGRPRKETAVSAPSAASAAPTGLPTPRKTPSSVAIRRAKATEEFTRPNGNIMLTPEELKMTRVPLVPPSEAEAHPPLAGLLFRYWTDDCFSKLNGNDEFLAGRFAKFSTFGAEAPPLPKLKDFKYFWHDVGAHMNREPVQSPWISTCNHLTWIIRLAVQESTKGITTGRITVLNAHALPRGAVFHAQPLHKELRKKRPFSNGAFRYQGMREFLVYHKIPKKAVLHTFTVQELLQLTGCKHEVGDLLRLHHLSKSQVALKTLTQTLEADDLKLNHNISAIAEVVRFFGLTSNATEGVEEDEDDGLPVITRSRGFRIEYETTCDTDED